MLLDSPFVKSMVTRSVHRPTHVEYNAIFYVHEDYLIVWYECGCVAVIFEAFSPDYDMYECYRHITGLLGTEVR